ncbi:MAG: hypothetical protein KC466_02695 [Myxococcales bacterium]|nr:hypothetical protein [Myxococcales bacterium]
MSIKTKATSAILAAAAAGFFGTALAADKPHSSEADVQCWGVNVCKGHNDCKTATNACKGQGSCKGHGWVKVSGKTCADIGGTAKPLM